ncbi:hypothetical protein F4802DRAFT_498188 [Xylaria palmicola]|nr:hypothetical protein F4802DRAFT_498188 [Xylaria palmicola]
MVAAMTWHGAWPPIEYAKMSKCHSTHSKTPVLTRHEALLIDDPVRVNYLQGLADFTVEPGLDVDQIVSKTRDATGFQISVMCGDESIDILTPSSQSSAAITKEMKLDGVGGLEPVDKRTVRIQYNPTIIGVRELYHNIEHLSAALATPSE